MTDPEPIAVRLMAAAIANARVMRRGSPPVSNVLDILPEKLRAEVMEDADAALSALLALDQPAPESNKCAECERLKLELAEAQKERAEVLKRVSEIELIPGQVAVPFFKTDEEYKVFQEWWKQNVTEALLAQHSKLR